MLKKLKMREKLVVLFGLLMLVTIFTQGMVSFNELNKSHDSTIAAVQDEFDSVIRTSVDGLIGALDANHQRYLDGEISKDEEMETAKKITRDARYNNGEGYFWADTADGVCAVHMNPEYEGKNRFDAQDLKGNLYIQNLIDAGNNEEGGFTEFYFPKPGEDGDFMKRGYTKKYEPYGWYVSTGNYYDDIEERLEEYENDKYASLVKMNVASALLAVVGIAIVLVVANQITKHLRAMIQRLTLLCQGDLHSPVPEVNTGDELETLSEATNETINNFKIVIDDIDNIMKGFSNGNFVLKEKITYTGDFNGIGHSIEKFVRQISETLLQINEASEQVAFGSEHLSSGAQELSHGVTEQADSIEDLSKTVGEIALHTKDTAENATKAKEISATSSDAIKRGHDQMNEMVAAMEEISSTSNEIGKIIKNIDDIAFQTNILALNAAVEAARAGASGKGFAVVADEVRNLAGKTAESAQSTATLIEKALLAIENGLKIVTRTSTTLDEVISSSEKSAEAIQSIADASIEQQEFIYRVNDGVEQISAVVHANSTNAEESAATSEELSAQAQMMKELIGKFQLQRVMLTTGHEYDSE